MRKVNAIKSGIVQRQASYHRKNKPSNGNRRGRKLKAEMKILRQQIARISNDIYRRTQKRSATTKKKELLNELKKLMGGVDLTTRTLNEFKESWIDKLRNKKVKLQRFIE